MPRAPAQIQKKKSKFYRKKRVMQPTAQFVKKIVLGMTEKKTQSNGFSAPLDAYSSLPGSSIANNTCNAFELTTVLSEITPGTANGQRISNSIRLVKCRLALTLMAYNGTQKLPTDVTVFIGRIRNAYNSPSSMANLYLNGNVDLAPTNSFQDQTYQINNNYWDIKYKKTFKIGNQTVVFGPPGTPAYNVANNDYKSHIVRYINLMPWLKKTIRYDQTNARQTNEGLYIWFTISNYDDTQIFPLTYGAQVQAGIQVNCLYTDN